MKYIKYRGANQVSLVSNALAGTFSYYAEAEDALDRHKFVEKIASSNTISPFDYLGKRFKIERAGKVVIPKGIAIGDTVDFYYSLADYHWEGNFYTGTLKEITTDGKFKDENGTIWPHCGPPTEIIKE